MDAFEASKLAVRGKHAYFYVAPPPVIEGEDNHNYYFNYNFDGSNPLAGGNIVEDANALNGYALSVTGGGAFDIDAYLINGDDFNIEMRMHVPHRDTGTMFGGLVLNEIEPSEQSLMLAIIGAYEQLPQLGGKLILRQDVEPDQAEGIPYEDGYVVLSADVKFEDGDITTAIYINGEFHRESTFTPESVPARIIPGLTVYATNGNILIDYVRAYAYGDIPANYGEPVQTPSRSEGK